MSQSHTIFCLFVINRHDKWWVISCINKSRVPNQVGDLYIYSFAPITIYSCRLVHYGVTQLSDNYVSVLVLPAQRYKSRARIGTTQQHPAVVDYLRTGVIARVIQQNPGASQPVWMDRSRHLWRKSAVCQWMAHTAPLAPPLCSSSCDPADGVEVPADSGCGALLSGPGPVGVQPQRPPGRPAVRPLVWQDADHQEYHPVCQPVWDHRWACCTFSLYWLTEVSAWWAVLPH